MTYADFIYYARGFLFITGGIASLIAIIVAWKAWRGKWLTPVNKLASTGNAFAGDILPDILERFEEKDLAPKGILKKWNAVIYKNLYLAQSPKYLNEQGKKILKESTIDKIINERYDSLIKEMEKHDLTTALDVENTAFYAVMNLKEDIEAMKPVKNYLFVNSEVELETVMFVGSFHLRDKYLDDHKDILEQNKQNPVKVES